MTRPVKTKFSWTNSGLLLGGWFQGKESYLWIGDEYGCGMATIEGSKLYRLAKAIVKEYENDRN